MAIIRDYLLDCSVSPLVTTTFRFELLISQCQTQHEFYYKFNPQKGTLALRFWYLVRTPPGLAVWLLLPCGCVTEYPSETIATGSVASGSASSFGIHNEPLFRVPCCNIIPCNLHMTMSLARLLRHQLLVSIDVFPDALKLFEQSLLDIGIKVYTPSEDTSMTLADRLEKTKFSRVNSMIAVGSAHFVCNHGIHPPFEPSSSPPLRPRVGR